MRRERGQQPISHWRLADVPGIELRKGIAVTEPYPRHWHEEYQLCLVQSGGGELFYRGTHHDTPAASLFIVHPGEVHSNQTEIGCSFRSIYIEPELMRRTVSSFTGREEGLPFFPDPMVFDREIIGRYLSLHLSSEDSISASEREYSVLHLVTRLIARCAQDRLAFKTSGKEPSAVKIVREYILSYYDQQISSKDLARLVNLSPFHLNRVFTREIGMPPHAFQTQLRVAKAKNLIREGLPLASVAVMTGFADQSHLIRHFKRLLKITPGEYLQTARTFNTGTRSVG